MNQGDLLHVVTEDDISDRRRRLGHGIVWGSAALLPSSFWRRSCRYAPLPTSASPTGGRRSTPTSSGPLSLLEPGADPGRAWKADALRFACRALRRFADRLPASLRLAHRFLRLEPRLADGPQFNGLDNIRQMWATRSIGTPCATWSGTAWPSCRNTPSPSAWRCCSTRKSVARKFFRVAFLLPLMLSPVAVSWMIGKSMLELRFGPIARLARWLGWDTPSFFGSPFWPRQR